MRPFAGGCWERRVPQGGRRPPRRPMTDRADQRRVRPRPVGKTREDPTAAGPGPTMAARSHPGVPPSGCPPRSAHPPRDMRAPPRTADNGAGGPGTAGAGCSAMLTKTSCWVDGPPSALIRLGIDAGSRAVGWWGHASRHGTPGDGRDACAPRAVAGVRRPRSSTTRRSHRASSPTSPPAATPRSSGNPKMTAALTASKLGAALFQHKGAEMAIRSACSG